MMRNSTSYPPFEVNRGWLTSGVVFLSIGFFLWLVGAALSGTALAKAAMKWISQLEESPSAMARRRAQQFKEAVSAGSKAWQEQSRPS